MKRGKKALFLLLFVTVVAVGSVFLVAADNDKPFLPGVTSTDDHPNGCIDCHKISGDRDHRLNVALAELEGHPKIDAITQNVPQDCLMCHKEGAAAGPFDLITHRDHYRDPEDNVYLRIYKGSCLHCHSIDTDSGAMAVKSGPKNW